MCVINGDVAVLLMQELYGFLSVCRNALCAHAITNIGVLGYWVLLVSVNFVLAECYLLYRRCLFAQQGGSGFLALVHKESFPGSVLVS